MVQKSGEHQLRLVGYPTIYRVWLTSQVVVWDFFHQQYFTNLDFPEIAGDFPSLATFWEPRSCEVAIIWPDSWDPQTIADFWLQQSSWIGYSCWNRKHSTATTRLPIVQHAMAAGCEKLTKMKVDSKPWFSINTPRTLHNRNNPETQTLESWKPTTLIHYPKVFGTKLRYKKKSTRKCQGKYTP